MDVSAGDSVQIVAGAVSVTSEGSGTTGTDISASNSAFANEKGSSDWTTGSESSQEESSTEAVTTEGVKTAYISDSMFDNSAAQQTPSYVKVDIPDPTKETRVPSSVKVYESYAAKYKTSWENEGRRKELKNQDKSIVQNVYGYPYHLGTAGEMLADKYDYSFIPGDKRYDGPTKNLEDRLKNLRAALGIPVHGNNDIARSVKFYMYNRFKTPDKNLAHNKTFTHIFFTRPDLNLLSGPNTAVSQVMNHTDTALLWRRNPELFKLLTDYRRCGDDNNFNMLLSNQIASFNIEDESLSTIQAGRSWNEHTIVYGDQYTGRTASDLSCTFDETSELSVINLLKLWITYIDNVSRGAWSPSYDIRHSHVFDRALDYGASIYIFKCGPDGEDVLYWSKYYGVIPLATGSSVLSWEKNGQIGDTPKPNIRFAYSYKKDLSPISLLEFNDVANVKGDVSWIPSYDAELGHCSRPYVGAPYIELDLGTPHMEFNDVNRSGKRTQIRLKFRSDTSTRRTDEILYKANL